MQRYLKSSNFNINESCIITAPTNTGKTTALLEYLKEKEEMCVLVSPLNPLSEQIYNKSSEYFSIINCDNIEKSIYEDILKALDNKKPIIISLTTFIKYSYLFYTYKVYLDEIHFLIEYNELMDTNKLINEIKNNKFKQIIGITATPLGLPELLNLKEIRLQIFPQYKRNITLNIMKNMSLSNILGTILKLYQDNGKLLILYNNTSWANKLSKELALKNINVKLFNSKQKDILIVNEKFSENYDIIICTTALTTGVSIRDEFYSVYIPQSFDTINTIPQFFSRNRNIEINGCILKKKYADYITKIDLKESEFADKTLINKCSVEILKDKLTKLNMNIGKESLEYWFCYDKTFNFQYGETFDISEPLKVEQNYIEKIENQREYFIDNIIPKFNIAKYPNLKKIYDIHEVVLNGEGTDNLINEYATKYNLYEHHFILDRDYFYDFYLPIVKMYKTDKGMKLAENTTEQSVDIIKFEQLFLDKPYDKTEFKNICIKIFAIKEEIFKNKNTIEIFLNKLGYCLKRGKSGSIIRKIK